MHTNSSESLPYDAQAANSFEGGVTVSGQKSKVGSKIQVYEASRYTNSRGQQNDSETGTANQE